MRGPDCHTDHSLIRSTFKFAIKPVYSRNETLRKKKLDMSKLWDRDCQENLLAAINPSLDRNIEQSSPSELWEILSKNVFEAAAEVLGFTKKKNSDWFNDNDKEIKRVIEDRNRALQNKLSNPSRANQEGLKSARAETQRKLREMENRWWLQKAQELQQKADENNSAGFFNSLKAVHGP